MRCFIFFLLSIVAYTAFGQHTRINVVAPASVDIIYENSRAKMGFSRADFVKEYDVFRKDYDAGLDQPTWKKYDAAVEFFRKSKAVITVTDSTVSPEAFVALKDLFEIRIGAMLLKKGLVDLFSKFHKEKTPRIIETWRGSDDKGDRYMFTTDRLWSFWIVSAYGVHTNPDVKEFRPRRDDEISFVKEEPATPAGGMAAFKMNVYTNMRYPEEAKLKGIKGKVLVEFIVGIAGSLTDFKVVKSIGGGCDEEAVRLIRDGVRWQPAKQDGQIVKQRLVLPIEFPAPEKY